MGDMLAVVSCFKFVCLCMCVCVDALLGCKDGWWRRGEGGIDLPTILPAWSRKALPLVFINL